LQRGVLDADIGFFWTFGGNIDGFNQFVYIYWERPPVVRDPYPSQPVIGNRKIARGDPQLVLKLEFPTLEKERVHRMPIWDSVNFVVDVGHRVNMHIVGQARPEEIR
jgi:hypothetical protein